MHPYSTNSEERFKVPFFLGALAIGIAWVFSQFASEARLPFYVEVPGTFTIYAILFALFREYIWKFTFLRYLHMVKVPNLEGEWVGHLMSSFDGAADKQGVTIHIKQNWTHIFIKLTAPNSDSRSVVSSIYESEGETILIYQYKNEPHATAVETMHAHTGTATLYVEGGLLAMAGDYYSGRDRTNYGRIVVRRRLDAPAAASA